MWPLYRFYSCRWLCVVWRNPKSAILLCVSSRIMPYVTRVPSGVPSLGTVDENKLNRLLVDHPMTSERCVA